MPTLLIARSNCGRVVAAQWVLAAISAGVSSNASQIDWTPCFRIVFA